MKNRREFIGASLAASAGIMLTGSSYAASLGSNTGPIMAIAAHPGDGMFTMGAAVAQHISNGGTGYQIGDVVVIDPPPNGTTATAVVSRLL